MNSLGHNNPDSAYTILTNGVRFHASLSFEEWLALGIQLMPLGRAIGFLIGDWINFGFTKYGEKYAEALTCTGIPYKTLANYAYIARKVDQSIREPRLGHEHHAPVAKLSPLEQKKWLGLAIEHDLSVRRLRKSIKFKRVVTEAEARENPADRRQITYLAMINQIYRLWRKEIKSLPAAKWEKDRRRALKNDFGRLREILEALD